MIKWVVFLLVILGTPAHAANNWSKASSDHFIVYSDQKEDDIRDFTDRLERYHIAMTARLRLQAAKPSPSNRVTIYVVRNEKQVQDLIGKGSRNVAGFYIPRAGGSIAFIPRLKDDSSQDNWSQLILLHEYAHHMLISTSSITYPLWLNEGFAEFHATAKFDKDGSVGLGLPAVHRAGELAYARDVSIEKLLDTRAYLAGKTSGDDAFYGRSWLLFHYLHFDPDRQGQIGTYLNLLLAGTNELEAAQTAFGDLRKLNRDMDRYLRRPRFYYHLVSGSDLQPGPITIEPLGPGASAVMPIHIQSKRGVNAETAAKLLPDARAVAAQYPNDAFVLSALAEAEYDAGNNMAAIDAANRAVAINPSQINAHLQKGYALVRIAKDADDQDEAWKNVRKQFLEVNRIENDHPIPLIQFYASYLEQGVTPTENAIDGLHWALQLSPFDEELRWMVGNQEMEAGEYSAAIRTLGPIAYNPHKSKSAEQALVLIDKAKEKLALSKAGDVAQDMPTATTH